MPITLFNAPLEPVHAPVFILHGQAAAAQQGQRVRVASRAFSDQFFETNGGYFKAVVGLEPGINEVHVSLSAADSTMLLVEYVPLTQNPPLHLCLLVAKDSPLQFDSVFAENGLEVACKKLKMAGRMMQAFTQQQMFRNGFGHRVFRFVEERAASSYSCYDDANHVERDEIKVHVLRSQKTLQQLRDPNMAQQNSKGTNTGGLFGLAMDELRRNLAAFRDDATALAPAYAAVMFLDTHWDPQLRLILTHAALGGGTDRIKLAIFGSHGLWSWPKHVDELAARFTDETRTDTSKVANDCNECSTAWECLNITMGAFMHEIGHLYGCPHEENGVMLRDYVTWNRTFMTREVRSVRTGKGPWAPVSSRDECTWHRLDVCRFLYHPAFALPQDFQDQRFKPPCIWDLQLKKRTPLKPAVFPHDAQTVSVEAKHAGVYLVTCHVGEWSRYHMEFLPRGVGGAGPATRVLLNYSDIQARLPAQFRGKRVDVEILANGGEQTRIDDFARLLKQNDSSVLRVEGVDSRCYKSPVLGRPEGKEQPLAVWKGFRITKVRIHSGLALDGVEFFGVPQTNSAAPADAGAPPIPPRNYSLSSTLQKALKLTSDDSAGGAKPAKEQFVCRIGNVTSHYHDFTLRPDETIAQFNVRCGAWVDGIQVVLTNGRTSQMFGGQGGGLAEMKPPDGMQIVAFYGHLGQWLNGIGIVYA